MTRSEILEQARKCVCGDREQDYGSPENNFRLIATLWECYLADKAVSPGADVCILPEDVAAMLGLLKIARIATGHAKEDNWIDLAGYAACGGEIQSGEEEAHEEPELSVPELCCLEDLEAELAGQGHVTVHYGDYDVLLRKSRDGEVFGVFDLDGMPAFVWGRDLAEAISCFVDTVDESEGEEMDHPVIRNMESTGYPDGKLPKWTCPFCGAECTTVYSDWHGEAVGCEHCVDRHNVEDFYGED